MAQAATPEDTGKARDHYKKGLVHFDLKEYGDALGEFKNAYRYVQDPAFLFNIAQCHRRLGQNREALDFYRNYLRRSPNASNRTDVEKRIDEIDQELTNKPEPAPVKPVASPPPVTTPPPAPAPTPAPAPSPARTPDAPRPSLSPSPPAATTPPPLDLGTTGTTPPPAEATPLYKKWWFWTGVGVVVAGVGVAAIAASKRSEIGDCKGISPCLTLGGAQ